MSAFGPQGANAATVRGTAQTRYSVDTWCKDCSGTNKDDGTKLDAQFFNVIIGNMREAVRKSGVVLNDNDMNMLYNAISKISIASVAKVTGANGVVVINNVVTINWDALDKLVA